LGEHARKETVDAPSGTVTIKRLTSTSITNSNESAENIVVTTNAASNFDPAATMTLPPYSMTLITSGGSQ
jgi:hypothetical protein